MIPNTNMSVSWQVPTYRSTYSTANNDYGRWLDPVTSQPHHPLPFHSSAGHTLSRANESAFSLGRETSFLNTNNNKSAPFSIGGDTYSSNTYAQLVPDSSVHVLSPRSMEERAKLSTYMTSMRSTDLTNVPRLLHEPRSEDTSSTGKMYVPSKRPAFTPGNSPEPEKYLMSNGDAHIHLGTVGGDSKQTTKTGPKNNYIYRYVPGKYTFERDIPSTNTSFHNRRNEWKTNFDNRYTMQRSNTFPEGRNVDPYYHKDNLEASIGSDSDATSSSVLLSPRAKTMTTTVNLNSGQTVPSASPSSSYTTKFSITANNEMEAKSQSAPIIFPDSNDRNNEILPRPTYERSNTLDDLNSRMTLDSVARSNGVSRRTMYSSPSRMNDYKHLASSQSDRTAPIGITLNREETLAREREYPGLFERFGHNLNQILKESPQSMERSNTDIMYTRFDHGYNNTSEVSSFPSTSSISDQMVSYSNGTVDKPPKKSILKKKSSYESSESRWNNLYGTAQQWHNFGNTNDNTFTNSLPSIRSLTETTPAVDKKKSNKKVTFAGNV